MSVVTHERVIELIGDCPVEDAEPLLAALRQRPDRVVDVTRAGWLHSAVFQVLLLGHARVRGPAGEPFVATWLVDLLAAAAPA